MSRIITIGREFGSGGRELGRRLSERLEAAYYDQEIITEIAKRTDLSEQYVQTIVEKRPIMPFPITVARSFGVADNIGLQRNLQIFQAQKQIIEEMAQKSDCIFVGRCADYILRDKSPFRIFVYADMDSKVARCKHKAPEQENLSDKEIQRNIAKIDRSRAQYYQFYTGQTWGDKANYDLCVNTTHLVIKDFVSVMERLLKSIPMS